MHKALLTLTLILVFGTSAFISISGLSAVFASAVITIVFMGCGMELGKILTVIHLHRRWNILNWLSRGFYATVIVALVLLTSVEIMGYLSQNHVRGFLGLKSNSVTLDALNQEETLLRNRIETIDKTLSGLPDSYVTKRLRERENAGYEGLQERLTEVITEKAALQRHSINNEAYSAPIFATARIFNIDETRAASMFIFFLIAVLEPLSIGLAVAVSSAWLPGRWEGVSGIQLDKQKEEKLGQVSQKEGLGTNVHSEDKIVTNVTNPEPDTTDPIILAIAHLINSVGIFTGTMTELHQALKNTDNQEFVGKNGWPEDAHSLGKQLKRLEQQLSEQGICVTRSRTQRQRKVELCRVESIGNDSQ